MAGPSRRTVLATGSAVGGTLMAGGLPAQATAAPREAADVRVPGDPWRTVLDDADLVWQQLPKTWYEGPYLGNGFLGSGIYPEPSPQPDGAATALRFNVQHSEVQDLPQALKEQGGPPSPNSAPSSASRACPSATSPSNPSAGSPASTGGCGCATPS